MGDRSENVLPEQLSWQSASLVMRMSRVQLLSLAPYMKYSGGVPEWSKGTDCKSVGEAFGGSNPPPTTSLKVGRMQEISVCLTKSTETTWLLS